MQQSGRLPARSTATFWPCVRVIRRHGRIIPAAPVRQPPCLNVSTIHPTSYDVVSRRSSAKSAGPSLAERADSHRIYQLAVQSPEADIGLMQHFYRSRRRRKAWRLREDFCGTALTLAHWVDQGARYSGEGFDIDPDPLEWGRRHNIEPLGTGAERAILHLADAREPSTRSPDIRCAFNFSYWVFRRGDEMLDYFRQAHGDLADGGMLVIDVTGGTESLSEEAYVSKSEGFEMVWQQENFSPVDHSAELTLRFRFRDGSEIDPPYRYNWRVWSIPELLELLSASGFGDIDIWWQDDDAGEYGYRRTRKGENATSWVACLAAFK